MEQLRRLGRLKSLTCTFRFLLYSAMKHGTVEELNQVENAISSTSPSCLRRLKSFILLELGKKAAFLEYLEMDLQLVNTQLRFMVDLAAKLKVVCFICSSQSHSLLHHLISL
ncbi:hypothetical protein GCK32_019982 [Trichostrongylus colubriformis]|uniref:Uncharacterized protein n=1 Tax=Trichostrongylus colubriformis TaxID=6319 RepID=A0AAN8FMY9_TRICO